MKKPLVLPVIHFLDEETTLQEAAEAFALGADGVFLISHTGSDAQLFAPAAAIKGSHKDKLVGINLLSSSNEVALDVAATFRLDMVWMDMPGVNSSEVTDKAKALAMAGAASAILLFGSVAFKYQPEDKNSPQAAVNAASIGMIPTTSGTATGSPPPVEKIRSMREAIGPDADLAVASGMTPENVADYAPYLSHILVSTGVSLDEYRLDPVKLAAFIKVIKSH